jgi:uncharacterized protein
VPWTVDGDVVRLAVRLTPRARRNEVAGVIEDRDGRAVLAIRLAAPPVDGAANHALVAFLATRLGLAKAAVAIVSGEKSRRKIVRLDGVSTAAVERLLGG